MNPEWYVWTANKIDPETDSEEEIERKKFNQSICAHKKPYFFQFNYLSLKRDYDKYVNTAKENAISLFKKSLDELLSSADLTEDEQLFVDNYYRKLPLDESPSVMNKICKKVEAETDGLRYGVDGDFSCLNIMTDCEHDDIYYIIENICKKYKSVIKKESDKLLSENEDASDFYDNIEIVIDSLVEEMYQHCPNAATLCDILIDLCYGCGYPKEIVWTTCGDEIINRLLDMHDGKLSYPAQSDTPDFMCSGTGYVMREIECRGDDDDDEVIV